MWYDLQNMLVSPKNGNSLAVQWLGLRALTARCLGSIPDPGNKIPRAAQRSQKRKKKSKKGLPWWRSG